MLSETMEAALNKQLNAELYSSYLYFSMSASMRAVKADGAANWMRVQAGEELVHVAKFFDYIASHGRVKLQLIDEPPLAWESPLAAFQHVLRHEKHVTSLINGLVSLAREQGDEPTYDFLQWFVEEQKEEEESAEKVLAKLNQAASGGLQLILVDEELGERK